jgi:hypothetical protein
MHCPLPRPTLILCQSKQRNDMRILRFFVRLNTLCWMSRGAGGNALPFVPSHSDPLSVETAK